MKKKVLFVLALFMVDNIYSQTFDVNPIWQFGTFGYTIGESFMNVIDIDNDSKNELLVSSSFSYSPRQDYFYILKYDPASSSYQFHWMSGSFNSEIIAIKLKDLNRDEYQDIIVGFKNGDIRFFDGKYLKEINHFSYKSESVNEMIIADVNNDGEDEIIICDNDSSYIFNLSFKIEMKIPHGANKMQFGNIDNDDALELILSSGKIIEIKDSEWKVEKEFDSYNYTSIFELFDVNEDDKLELIFQTRQNDLICLDLASNSPIWSVDPESGIESVHLYTNINTNELEIYLGTRTEGIKIYEASDGNFIKKAPDNRLGIMAIAIGDVDNDGENELIWSENASCGHNCSANLFIHNLEDFTEEWRTSPLNGPFISFDYGDVDNDGENEVVIVSGSSGTHDGGIISVFNFQDKSLEWRSEPYMDEVSAVKISDINNDGINELLVGVLHTDLVVPNTYLYIYETNTFQIDTAIHLYDSRQIGDIEVSDINNDGTNEIVLGTGSGYGGDKSHIYILSGESKELLWQSEELGGTLNFAFSINISNIDNDDALEIVGVDFEYDGELFIIDGSDYSTRIDDQHSYTSLTLGDYDRDGQQDIIAGTKDGDIVILDGENLEVDHILDVGPYNLISIGLIESSDADKADFLFSNAIQLKQVSFEMEDIFVSDDHFSALGVYNNMIVSNLNSDDHLEAIIGSNHSLRIYTLNPFEVVINEYPWDSADNDDDQDDNDDDQNDDNDDDNDATVTGIEENNTSNTVAYPNPFNGLLTFSFNSKYRTETIIELYNQSGQLLLRNKFMAEIGENKSSISTNYCSRGIYGYRLTQDGNIVDIGKVIKLN